MYFSSISPIAFLTSSDRFTPLYCACLSSSLSISLGRWNDISNIFSFSVPFGCCFACLNDSHRASIFFSIFSASSRGMIYTPLPYMYFENSFFRYLA
ncbi:hypothetical protein HAV1_gp40 [Hyperthermophilic Archaeal Virus 1]|uniref:hypothetical protein n=1 Tax=Hyperthermophilic Archaeal Virus 1 TaxID=762905 RepID=UPI0001DBAE13|nr:hypothetical protein HAV1_gp40 [Hyperthermophilic Archaeal Virus 1]ADJ54263.1 hypothetical protein HAV1_gp40 [Hyperthermophilic Archaeal Virus 1]